jgi:phosphoenolpyruvate synthase/pyruvate phosphate dikinase
MLPESLDPDLTGYVWNEQYTATKSNLAKTGKGWKDEFNAVTGMFRDNEGVIRQGLDTQSEVIALRELADLRNNPEGKVLSPTDRIMAAYTYPERALKEYKQVMTQALEANKDNPDAAKIAMQNIRNTWISLYGFTPESHEELLAGKLE